VGAGAGAGGTITGVVAPLQVLAVTWVQGWPLPVGPLAVSGEACVHQLAR
jgi:hypothetical protein